MKNNNKWHRWSRHWKLTRGRPCCQWAWKRHRLWWFSTTFCCTAWQFCCFCEQPVDCKKVAKLSENFHFFFLPLFLHQMFLQRAFFVCSSFSHLLQVWMLPLLERTPLATRHLIQRQSWSTRSWLTSRTLSNVRKFAASCKLSNIVSLLNGSKEEFHQALISLHQLDQKFKVDVLDSFLAFTRNCWNCFWG